MATEESTYRLYQRFKEGVGMETATVLMEHLDTFATKQDIADLRATVVTKSEFREAVIEIKTEITAAMHESKAAIHNAELGMYRALLATFLVMMGTNAGIVGLVAFLR